MELVQAYGPDSPIIKISEPKLVVSKMRDLKVLNSKDSIILSPQSILELYSPKTLQMGEMSLRDIYCFADDSVYVVIDSHLNSLPPPMQKMRTNNLGKSSNLPTESATATKHVIKCCFSIFNLNISCVFKSAFISELCLGE